MTLFEIQNLKPGELIKIQFTGAFGVLKSFNYKTNKYELDEQRSLYKFLKSTIVVFVAYTGKETVIFLWNNKLYCCVGTLWVASLDNTLNA